MWLKIVSLAVCLNTVLAFSKSDIEKQARLVEEINSIPNTWTATTDYESTLTIWDIFTYSGGCSHNSSMLDNAEGIEVYDDNFTPEELEEVKKLPDTYDVRKKWGKRCKIVNKISDQSHCGSCWAFGSAEAMQDRMCILGKGKKGVKKSIQLSTANLVACDKENKGCKKGSIFLAYQYLHKSGIVSGGDYNSKEGCWPYPFPHCDSEHNSTHINAKCPEHFNTPNCTQECQPGYKRRSFKKDRHFGKTPRNLRSVKRIMHEIFKNGPVTAGFIVYEDFRGYNGSVYYHKTGQAVGGHAVKLLGWGTEDGMDYWLAANSWGTNWGLKGFFKIRKGTNECEIENVVVGSMPYFKPRDFE